MKKILFQIALILISIHAFGQISANKSPLKLITKSATVNVSQLNIDFSPVFYTLEMPAPGSESYRRYLVELKEKMKLNSYTTNENNLKTTSETPGLSVVRGFIGNPMGNGVPNDNDMAISNDGKLISVINSSIYIYDTENADTLLKIFSLAAFSDTLNLIHSDFDPRVYYDPRNDKFVLTFLNGYTPETSNIIVAFSKTNDPLGEWNLYAITGNPKDNNLWTDYPMIALTENEVFITGNLIIPDEPWQTGFSETLIWQMNLHQGYNGEDMETVFWDSIYYAEKPVRNLCPVKGGSTTYGPDMYFLSNRNFSTANDSIFIVHITGTLSDPLTTVEVDLVKSDVQYGVPPFARQYNDHEFDTNDGRILEGLIENGMIQFVSNTLDPTTGFCGIFHGVIHNLEGIKKMDAFIIGDDTLDLGYPDMSYTGQFETDIQTIITCDHSSPEVNAGMSAFFYNDTYSDRTTIYTGDSYVNVLSGTYERWGDYTGSQRKYNEAYTIWVNGNFGRKIEAGPITYHNNATWIAKLKSNDSLPYSEIEGTNNIAQNQSIYPNPFTNLFQTDIHLLAGGELIFTLYNAEGKKIKTLLSTKATAGKNRFQFSTASLDVGIYILQVEQNGKMILSDIIIKQ